MLHEQNSPETELRAVECERAREAARAELAEAELRAAKHERDGNAAPAALVVAEASRVGGWAVNLRRKTRPLRRAIQAALGPSQGNSNVGAEKSVGKEKEGERQL